MFSSTERRYVEAARVGRLATADGDGRPHVVPVCFALVDALTPAGVEGSDAPDGSNGFEGGDAWIATPIDEKPKDAEPTELRRVGDVRENPSVALVVDHWSEEWDDLGWVQVRGTASVVSPGDRGHGDAVDALRGKYDQYADHALRERPVVRIDPGHVVSWGSLRRPGPSAGDRPESL